ncbi:MAG TPA: hypothetical protein VFL94_02335 [Actinomycetales bacterium]|nr:hypothetical protein [Actinomycetales bacterium]
MSGLTSDFTVAALAQERIRDLRRQAVEDRLVHEATARRRASRAARQSSVGLGMRLNRVWGRRSSTVVCCVA